MPTQISSLPQLIEIVRTGNTEATLSVIAGLAGVTAAWAHWRKVKEPGHFDHIDAECAAQAGLSPEMVEHIDHDLNPRLKERIRRFFVGHVEDDVPVTLKYKPVHGDEQVLRVAGGDGEITLTVEDPV